tara:strand:+ start:261 stop:521 length:261 start_codon:yes stop_codon:yes gene_type:complete
MGNWAIIGLGIVCIVLSAGCTDSSKTTTTSVAVDISTDCGISVNGTTPDTAGLLIEGCDDPTVVDAARGALEKTYVLIGLDNEENA